MKPKDILYSLTLLALVLVGWLWLLLIPDTIVVLILPKGMEGTMYIFKILVPHRIMVMLMSWMLGWLLIIEWSKES